MGDQPLSDKDRRSRDRKDMQRLIDMIMRSPVGPGILTEVDGSTNINAYNGKNVDVRTRILLQTSISAMNGDLKSAEFIFKYGGYEPPKEAEISLELPTFVDDMTLPERNVTPLVKVAEPTKLEQPKKEKKKKKNNSQCTLFDDIITDTEDIPVHDISGR